MLPTKMCFLVCTHKSKFYIFHIGFEHVWYNDTAFKKNKKIKSFHWHLISTAHLKFLQCRLYRNLGLVKDLWLILQMHLEASQFNELKYTKDMFLLPNSLSIYIILISCSFIFMIKYYMSHKNHLEILNWIYVHI